jgi:hypothetical protein
MSDKVTELTSTQVQKLTGLSRSKLRFWTDGKVLNIRPSVASGRQGAATLFSIGDYYMVCLAQAAALGKQANFAAIGLAIDAISQHPDWERWEANRGQIFASIMTDNRVSLQYSARVKPGTRIPDPEGIPQHEGLARVMDASSQKRRAKLTPEELHAEYEAAAASMAVCTILVFDLKLILGEADQRLEKLLG